MFFILEIIQLINFYCLSKNKLKTILIIKNKADILIYNSLKN